MSCLKDKCPEELILLASSVAIAISQNKSAEQIGNLGDFFSAVGQNLSLISGAKEE